MRAILGSGGSPIMSSAQAVRRQWRESEREETTNMWPRVSQPERHRDHDRNESLTLSSVIFANQHILELLKFNNTEHTLDDLSLCVVHMKPLINLVAYSSTW